MNATHTDAPEFNVLTKHSSARSVSITMGILATLMGGLAIYLSAATTFIPVALLKTLVFASGIAQIDGQPVAHYNPAVAAWSMIRRSVSPNCQSYIRTKETASKTTNRGDT
jgi:uncharacterized membrane protein HdeD (DUF308 family)